VTGGIAVAIDVTDRKEAEEKVVRQEALARLGSMAAVVAHEVKNRLRGSEAPCRSSATGCPPAPLTARS